eukprot:jgi/Orpsp1_1/1184407/evm.model.c7180000089405.2
MKVWKIIMKISDPIFVFLDELNTCNSLGLITELMLKRTCKGKKIKENVRFIGACNPYRLDIGKKEVHGLYDESKFKNKRLVYTVNPLPQSLLNFVFDFGMPKRDDIKRYISNMVHKTMEKTISNKKIFNEIKPMAEQALFNAHEYIKSQYDISTVSLREIRRWDLLFEWFNQFLKNKYFSKKFNFSDEKIYKYSLNLSIYLCYYIRIFDKRKREHFLEEMKKPFGPKFNFEKFPKVIQEIIADAVDLDVGIAKNRPLLENLMAIFVCINVKIPLFIVGKPGCSKSLSCQLIFKSMKGKNSANKFFKEYLKVYTKSYQGSLTSNSEGVLKIFESARNFLNDKKLINKIIPTIFYDEMNLSEYSKNNPLKVIHSQLEYDDNEKKVAFIGISNYCLDASKMNRGIHISIPEPDEEDLKTTALSISESYNSKLNKYYLKYFEYLAITYFKFKDYLKTHPEKFESKLKHNVKEFFGTRDFYFLIKTACELFIKRNYPKGNIAVKTLYESIESNFGGLSNSIKIFKEILRDYIPYNNIKKEYDVVKCITNNINNPNSRYLLLITKNSISQFLISSILDQLGKKQAFYYGSNFEEDISQGHYTAKELNKIQVTMSKDNTMVLKKLEILYPSLYDLFNQNYRKVGDSKYAKIALGNANTQYYFVHDNFRCI